MTVAKTPETGRETPLRPDGKPYRNVTDIRAVSTLGVGMIIGAVLGAGVALLVAPRAGYDTRKSISRKVDRMRGRRGVWGRLGRELRRAAAAKRKTMTIEAKRKEIQARPLEI